MKSRLLVLSALGFLLSMTVQSAFSGTVEVLVGSKDTTSYLIAANRLCA